MTVEHPIYLWLFLILPLIWLYQFFCRKSTRELVVPCLDLWACPRAESQRGSFGTGFSKWHTIRENLVSIFLVSTLFASLVLGLANPITQTSEVRFVIVLDNSGSMQVKESNETRWQLACQTLNTYLSRGTGIVLLVAPKPQLVSPEQLPNIKPVGEPGQLEQSIELARNLLQDNDTLVIITDGAGSIWKRLLALPTFSSNSQIIHIIGNATENTAVALREVYGSLNTSLNFSIAVTNYGLKNSNISLYWRFIPTGKSQGEKSEHVDLLVGSSQTISHNISIADINGGEFHCWINEDSYPLDNSVTCTIPPPTKAKILVISDHAQPHLMAAFATYPELIDREASSVSSGTLPAETKYDLVVVCKKSFHDFISHQNYLLWGTDLSFLEKSPPLDTTVCWGVANDHPITKYLNLSELQVKNPQCYLPSPQDRVLAYGNRTPLIWEGHHMQMRYIYVAFAIENSQFPLLPAFPIFIHNVIYWSIGNQRIASYSLSSKVIDDSDIIPAIQPEQKCVRLVQRQQPWRYFCLYIALLSSIGLGFMKFISLLIRHVKLY